MFVSVFNMFKIGVGPSSSHTMGPMLAARRFLDMAQKELPQAGDSFRLQISLFGSLAFTGVGHGTCRAIYAGLLGFLPDENMDGFEPLFNKLKQEKCLTLGNNSINFDPDEDLIIDKQTKKPLHANALSFEIFAANGAKILSETYYSVGGGFIMSEEEIKNPPKESTKEDIPFPFHNANEMLEMGNSSGLSIAQMKRANELSFNSESDLQQRLDKIWRVMNDSIERGLRARGELPGGLHVKRRAGELYEALRGERGRNNVPLHSAIDWLSAYAMAVNEENAAGGRVVTAPTNGAAGVLPAVIKYYLEQVPGASEDKIPEMLLTAAAIGGLIKYNASISGAEVGCQGEIGSASAMAAAALCAAMGGTNEQIENAAEIALEHHLGMTCDPVKGLVQIPCIERNGMGAVKAVAAASLATHGDGTHLVSLDACIETMRVTGRDMDMRYKETSLGGLSVKVVDC